MSARRECKEQASDSLVEILGRPEVLGSDALSRARLVQQESGERLEVVVTRLGLLSEDMLRDRLEAATGLPIMRSTEFPLEPCAADMFSVPFLRDNRVLPVAMDGEAITIALVNPFDAFVLRAVAFSSQRAVHLRLVRATDLDAAIDRLYARDQDGTDVADEAFGEDDLERMRDLVSDAPAIRAVNRLIAQASDAGASDIHLEPREDALTVRFRVDGVLREMPSLAAAMRTSIVSRVKIMANLNIAEKRLPQDGRLRLSVRGHDIDLRVATAPSIHGESVVMRILDKSRLALDFPSLGFDEALTASLRRAIHRPFGIVLVTGPTGSGKTTTLYAALAELNSAERKLLTIEDPIEYRLPGVVQAQVSPGIDFTFAAALRSFLRQDPDVIMVGEIRDGETAQIAVQAALTGHMILSTLHTNSAAGAVTRLNDMGVEPFLLGSVLSGVLAQRLVRRLCSSCRAPYEASDELLSDLGLIGEADAGRTFHHAVGCEACGQSGYAGRIGLFEFLEIDETVSRLILHRADTRDIAAAGAKAGMRSLWRDGVAKARLGLTTLEEAARVAVEE